MAATHPAQHGSQLHLPCPAAVTPSICTCGTPSRQQRLLQCLGQPRQLLGGVRNLTQVHPPPTKPHLRHVRPHAAAGAHGCAARTAPACPQSTLRGCPAGSPAAAGAAASLHRHWPHQQTSTSPQVAQIWKFHHNSRACCPRQDLLHVRPGHRQAAAAEHNTGCIDSTLQKQA